MPKKRNSSWSRNKKEKQIITARLIQISLKIDDYVYKHKLISVCEAQQYLREVNSYKTQCNQDERSLQVIEKLTRCMKAIILDHHELRPNIHSENNVSSIADGGDPARSISPVYSLPDEDRTQLTQIAEATSIDVTVANKEVEIIDFSNIDDDNDLIHNETSTATADNASSKITVEVDIHRGMSSFCLRDVEAPFNITSDVNCSQSILNIANKDVEIIDLSNIDDDNDLIHNETSTSTADNAGSKITVEVDLHRGMSSLSLRDVEAPFNITSDVNCSQSILNNFEGVDQIQQNEIIIVSQGAVAGGLVGNVADEGKAKHVMQAGGNTTVGNIPNKKTTFIIEPNKTMKTSIASNKPNIIRNTKSNLIYKTVVQIEENNNSLTMTSNQKENFLSQVPSFYPATNDITDSQRQTWYDSNKTCTINDSSHTLKDANNSTQSAHIYKAVNPIIGKNAANFAVNISTNTFNAAEKENQPIKAAGNSRGLTNNTAIVQDDNTTIKKKRSRKKKTVEEKEKTPKNKRVYQPPKKYLNKKNTFTNSEKNKSIPIYNENVINDLSWIENIRYVREIKVDENDPTLNLEESFWDNYYLPANWGDDEFL